MDFLDDNFQSYKTMLKADSGKGFDLPAKFDSNIKHYQMTYLDYSFSHRNSHKLHDPHLKASCFANFEFGLVIVFGCIHNMVD
jgi:hypothetical protein